MLSKHSGSVRNLSEGAPRGFTLNSNEILEALQEPLQAVVGAVLTGGGALLRDIDKLIMEEIPLPVLIADDPLTCVVRGGGRILELTCCSEVSSRGT